MDDTRLAKGKVLIVDDDPVSQMVLLEAIKDSGKEAICADSGEEAWERIQGDPSITIALVDWLMPGMDGAELCQRIKKEVEDRYVYTIMVTAKDTKNDIMTGLAAGADDYVSKPVHPGELASRIKAGERVLKYEFHLKLEREKSDRLLNAVLPTSIAERLRGEEKNISDFHSAASILFIDIVGFTEWCMSMDAQTMISELADLFAGFDEEIAAHGLEKIKSIGDAYMVASGLPESREDHAHAIVNLAISIRNRIEKINQTCPKPWLIRSGIASGPVIAGVIGEKRFIYDAWGHTVNLASRLESLAPTDKILVCQDTYTIVKDAFLCKEYKEIKPKGLPTQTAWEIVKKL
jgi:adenylate cyclase